MIITIQHIQSILIILTPQPITYSIVAIHKAIVAIHKAIVAIHKAIITINESITIAHKNITIVIETSVSTFSLFQPQLTKWRLNK